MAFPSIALAMWCLTDLYAPGIRCKFCFRSEVVDEKECENITYSCISKPLSSLKSTQFLSVGRMIMIGSCGYRGEIFLKLILPT